MWAGGGAALTLLVVWALVTYARPNAVGVGALAVLTVVGAYALGLALVNLAPDREDPL